ncbi:hypothetical protein RchiOBHm_Chr6g0283831 [Rosa chinensis]|uniref:Uncharacterized protein n=1 Tax=Rosa chinensis TaxID=74649 RepID=A0A2P6PU54_ROSCH|nr:hypothetical protein RchiOBHm_Chr6g0283831 [Rosa chinensis]
MDYHYVREMVLSKFLHVSYLSTTQQPADIFTKSLSKDRFHFLRGKLPVRATPFSLRGILIISCTHSRSHLMKAKKT